MKLTATVLDDDPLIVSLLSKVLGCRGYEVNTYPDAYQSCPLYKSESCPPSVCEPCTDVILCDVNMPVVGGLDFLERQKRRGCKCRHIGMMSGAWTETDLLRASDLGVKCFPKPFDLDQINAWLDDAEAHLL